MCDPHHIYAAHATIRRGWTREEDDILRELLGILGILSGMRRVGHMGGVRREGAAVKRM